MLLLWFEVAMFVIIQAALPFFILAFCKNLTLLSNHSKLWISILLLGYYHVILFIC